MSIEQALEILKKIQEKTATQEEKDLMLKAFEVVSKSVNTALKGV